MRNKSFIAALALVLGAAVVGPGSASAPPSGMEQFEEWFDGTGNLVGYVHWTCNGDVETWGTHSGRLQVTRRAC